MGAFGAPAETAPWDKARAARMAKQRVRRDGVVFMGDIEFLVFRKKRGNWGAKALRAGDGRLEIGDRSLME